MIGNLTMPLFSFASKAYSAIKNYYIKLARKLLGKNLTENALRIIALWGFIITFLSFILGALAIIPYFNPKDPDSGSRRGGINPMDHVPHKSSIETYNRLNEPLWRVLIKGEISKSMLVDLDGDGKNELVVGVNGGKGDTGKLLAFDHQGARLWECSALAKYPYNGGQSNIMNLVTFEVIDHPGYPGKEILAIANDLHWYPSRLILVSNAGKIIKNLWHPGGLHHLLPTTINGKQALVVGGINNDLRQTILGDGSDNSFRCVFALEVDKIAGEAPPYLGSLKPGPLLWYGVFFPQGVGMVGLELADTNGDGEREICAWMVNGNIIYLNRHGKLVGRGRGDNAKKPLPDFRLIPMKKQQLMHPGNR